MEVIVETSILGTKVNYGSAGMKYGGVIATTKGVTDFWKAM
jgi:hypothetical protein